MDTVVQAAGIQATGSIVASVIAAGVAAWIGKRWLNQQKLREQLEVARSDIGFLLEVERQYIDRAKEIAEMPGKNSVRDDAKIAGYSWSGQNVPSKLKPNRKE